MKAYVLPFIKAVVAGVGAAIASLVTAVQGEADTITTQEWLIAAGAALAVFTSTFFIPYSPLGSSSGEPSP